MSEKVGEHAHDAKHAKDEEKGGQNEPQVGDCGNPGGASTQPNSVELAGWLTPEVPARPLPWVSIPPNLQLMMPKKKKGEGGFDTL